MDIIKIFMVVFVGQCLCEETEEIDSEREIQDITPELEIQYIKNKIEFHDKFFFKHYLLTEERTCENVEKVVQKMRGSIESDLTLLLAGPRRHLNQTVPKWNRRAYSCLRNIEDDINDVIKAGTKELHRCTEPVPITLKQLVTSVKEKRDEYEETMDFVLANIDECLKHDNINSEEHFRQCINRMTGYISGKYKEIIGMFNDSECMNLYEQSVFKCGVNIFEKVSRTSTEFHDEIYNCVGYYSSHEVTENYEEEMSSTFDRFKTHYSRLNEEILRTFMKFESTNSSLTFSKSNHQEYFLQLQTVLQPYYFTINQTSEENRSIRNSNCSADALKRIENLTLRGSQDFEDCRNNTFSQAVEELEKLENVLNDINTKMSLGGNVAILKCVEERPQQIFGFETVQTCIDLALRYINHEWKFAEHEINKTLNDVDPFTEFEYLKSPCGELKLEQITLEADQILYDCQRCLFGHSGYYYPVTTPTVDTTTIDQFLSMTRGIDYGYTDDTDYGYTNDDYQMYTETSP